MQQAYTVRRCETRPSGEKPQADLTVWLAPTVLGGNTVTGALQTRLWHSVEGRLDESYERQTGNPCRCKVRTSKWSQHPVVRR
jgi:hypothetical protein